MPSAMHKHTHARILKTFEDSAAPLNESIVNAYRRQSKNSLMFISASTGVEPESSGEHVSHYNNFLSGFAVRIECDRARAVFCFN